MQPPRRRTRDAPIWPVDFSRVPRVRAVVCRHPGHAANLSFKGGNAMKRHQSFDRVRAGGAGVVVAMWIAWCCAPAWAQFNIVKIADTSTPIPNGTGNFTLFDHAPIVSIDGVAFRGLGAGQEGIYAGGQSSIQRFADRNTIMPGTSSPFATFGSPSGVGGSIVFNGSNTTRAGIYEAMAANTVQMI